MTTPTSEPTREDVYREFASGEDDDGLYGIQIDTMVDEIINLRTALANAEREREEANACVTRAVESQAIVQAERDALQRTVAGMRERKDGVTLYLFDHGDCTMYCRNASTFLVEVMCGDELPESLFDDSDEGVFLVFDGVVHDNTQDATDEDLEARGLPTSAKHYDAWWVGSMRPATDVEILSVFGNEALTTPTREGSV